MKAVEDGAQLWRKEIQEEASGKSELGGCR